MRVLFVTSECVPLFKLGGLGDVSYALPMELHRLRIDVTIALPYYRAIHTKTQSCIGSLAVDYKGKRELVFVFEAFLPDATIPVVLFRHPILDDYHAPGIEERFAFYSQVVRAYIQYEATSNKHAFDIVHCQDWHTALVPVLLGETNKLGKTKKTLQSASTKTILTIHNLLYQGKCGKHMLKDVSLPESVLADVYAYTGPRVSLLELGIAYADEVTTVSETYAKEILTPEYGAGLERVLQKRKLHVRGILNGIDQQIWDPSTDDILPATYTAQTAVASKQAIKQQLQRAVGLPVHDVPLFGFVGRLERRQKGIDLIVGAIQHLNDAVAQIGMSRYQIVILGTGEFGPELKKEIGTKDSHIAFIDSFDERLARKIYAGSDVMLVPSKFEPCGLTQMIAMRYGTLPLVRNTGGLADSVTHNHTGFVFESYEVASLADAMKNAIRVYTSEKARWNRMITACMKKDFSWTLSAKKYARMYTELLRK